MPRIRKRSPGTAKRDGSGGGYGGYLDVPLNVKKGALKAEADYVNPKADIRFWSKFKEGKRKLQNAPYIVSPEVKSIKHKKMGV